MRRTRVWWWGLGALVLLLASSLVALGIGAVEVGPDRVAAVVARRLGAGERPFSGAPVTAIEDQVVWQLRLPRVLGALAVGAILAVCGAVLQSLTRNDLADPFLLGISSGASVGAVSVIVFGVSFGSLVGSAAISAAAFVGALLAMAAVLVIARDVVGGLSPTRTVLAGVAIAHLGGAYTSVAVIMSGQGEAARRVLNWTLGSLAGFRWDSVALPLLAAFVVMVVGWSQSDRLDGFTFGETSAASLGVPVARVRWALMVLTALATAVSVAYAGAIGFVGLVVPHLVRPLTSPRHQVLLPLSALTGAVLLLWADTLARSVVPGQEIPIGAVTALVGVPALIVLMLRRQGMGQAVAVR